MKALSKALVLAGATTLAGWTLSPALAVDSAEWAKIVEAAKKEGTVTIYTAQGLDQLADLTERFKKEYGINIVYTRGGGAALWPKIDAEFATGKHEADMFVLTDLPDIKERTKKGWGVAPVGAAFDDPLYDKKARMPEGTYFTMYGVILTFSWNKDLYPKGIKDYPDIFDPALVGKIGVTTPAVAPTQVDFFQYLDENYGADFVKKLAAMKPRIYPGALPQAQAVVSGEIAVGLSTLPLITEQAKGAPVGWGLAKPAWGSTFYGMILKDSPHPNAAQVLANYVITRAGQEAVANLGGAVLPDVKGAIADEKNVRHINFDKLTPDFVRTYIESWNAMFQAK